MLNIDLFDETGGMSLSEIVRAIKEGALTGYSRKLDEVGKIQLWKGTTLLTSQDENGLWVATSVSTGLQSFHLGTVHSISSAGASLVVKNQVSGINAISIAHGITTDALTLVPAATRSYKALVNVFPAGAFPTTATVLDYMFQTTFADNTSVFGIELVAGEAYKDKLTWKATYTSGKEISAFSFDVDVLKGNTITVPIEYPLDARAGAIVNVELRKADGTAFKAGVSATDASKPWRKLKIRQFVDEVVPVTYRVDVEYAKGAVVIRSDLRCVANSAIPAGTVFAWGASYELNTWSLDPSSLSSGSWRGVWSLGETYNSGDTVAFATAADVLFACLVPLLVSNYSPNGPSLEAGHWVELNIGVDPNQVFAPSNTDIAGRRGIVPAPPAMSTKQASETVLLASGGWGAGLPVATVIEWEGDKYNLAVPDGWWKCDGTVINSPGSLLHNKNAPDHREFAVAGASTANPANTTQGADTKTLLRTDLPNINLNGSTGYTPSGAVNQTALLPAGRTVLGATAGKWMWSQRLTGTSSDYYVGVNTGTTLGEASLEHNHSFSGNTVTLSMTNISLNGGVTQTAFDNRQKTRYVTKLIKL
jgi:hypothetical protein